MNDTVGRKLGKEYKIKAKKQAKKLTFYVKGRVMPEPGDETANIELHHYEKMEGMENMEEKVMEEEMEEETEEKKVVMEEMEEEEEVEEEKQQQQQIDLDLEVTEENAMDDYTIDVNDFLYQVSVWSWALAVFFNLLSIIKNVILLYFLSN